MAKELFAGSDMIRRFGYKAGRSQDNYALFWETDCFVFHSPYDSAAGNTAFFDTLMRLRTAAVP